ncbi:hypothetical protein ACFYUH_16325 [Streptomyces fimicarius]|uniref:hypothetical protein n=1 Tax=Streptomyces griseus TaxID=1911 RepID=UPI00367BF4A5
MVKTDWSRPAGPLLHFSTSQYFDLIDQNEAVAHELAGGYSARATVAAFLGSTLPADRMSSPAVGLLRLTLQRQGMLLMPPNGG